MSSEPTTLPQNLPLVIPALRRTLATSDQLLCPVGEQGFTAYGEGAALLEEVALFLRELLRNATPETLTRLVLPKETELVFVEAILKRPDLPRRLQIQTPIALPCVVVPVGESSSARWVQILPLRQILYVNAKDDLHETVRLEAERLVQALCPTPLDYLRYFPEDESLEFLPIELPREEGGGTLSAKRRMLAKQEERKEALAIVESVSSKRIAPAPAKLVARKEELTRLTTALSDKEKSRQALLLLGPALSGKTALFASWLKEEERRGNTPVLVSTSYAQLIAGMSGLGQWQERLRKVLLACETLDAVLYFENLGDLFAEKDGGYVDIPGAIRPFLEQGRVRLVGELTPEALDLCERRNPGFFSCLQRLRVAELSTSDTTKALVAFDDMLATQDGIVDPLQLAQRKQAIGVVVDLCSRYLPYQAFPGKALRLYGEVLAACKRSSHAADPSLTPGKVYDFFSTQSGVPALLLREDLPLSLDEIRSALQKRVIGQEAAVRCLAETVCVMKAALGREGRPLGSYLFVGPTGVGKTEMARALSRFLFGSDGRLSRFDMSEYMDPEAAERLIRGSDRDDGLLTRKVREQPFCLLLLDEIEKAHPAVFDLLLQVLGEGRLTDVRGRTAYFHNTIIIMTSNLGAGGLRPSAGFVDGGTAAQEAHGAHYLREARRTFRPEFIGRLDRIVPFHPLSRAEVAQIAGLLTEGLGSRRGLRERGLTLAVSPEALAILAEDGFAQSYGARQLRRHVEDHLVAPIARWMANLEPHQKVDRLEVTPAQIPETPVEGTLVVSSAVVGKLRVRGLVQRGRVRGHTLRGLDAITALRKEAYELIHLDTVETVKEQLEFLVAQIAERARRGRKGKQQRLQRDVDPAKLGQLQSEHQALNTPYQAAQSAFSDLLSVEELALGAVLAGEDCAPLLGDAKKAMATLRRQMVPLLLSLLPKREKITLLCQELDDGGAFDIWLVPLLHRLEERRWSATIHVEGDGARGGEGRRFGEPRSPAWVLERLAGSDPKDRPFKAVLLCVSGPLCGPLLAMEAGRLRFESGDGATELFNIRSAFRHQFAEHEWKESPLRPLARGNATELTRVVVLPKSSPYSGMKVITTLEDGSTFSVECTEANYWDNFDDVALGDLVHMEKHGIDPEVLLKAGLPQNLAQEGEAD